MYIVKSIQCMLSDFHNHNCPAKFHVAPEYGLYLVTAIQYKDIVDIVRCELRYKIYVYILWFSKLNVFHWFET